MRILQNYINFAAVFSIFGWDFSSKENSKVKNNLNGSLIAVILGLLFLTSIEVEASTLSFIGGEGSTLPGNWNPAPAPLDLEVGDGVTIFDEGGEGVWLDGAANLIYTYIGKEAGSTNAFLTSSTSSPDELFLTANYGPFSGTVPGSSFETTMSSAGFLDFSFIGLGTCCVEAGVFTNGLGISEFDGESNDGLVLAAALISSSTAYLMFGDGFGDSDLDDMVVRVDVSPVPVPAAVWLFGTALIGIFGFRRRKSQTI